MLFCYECPKLKYLPSIKKGTIECSDCPMIIGKPLEYLTLNCRGCNWLNVDLNTSYNYNVNKLIIIQRFFKNILLVRRFQRLIPLLMPLYYHPVAKGGYFHKKEMLEFLTNVNDE